MGFTLEHYCELRPYLYHLTEQSNLTLIRKSRELQSAASLLTAAGLESRIGRRRRSSEIIQVGGISIHLRDQAPLHAGNIRFEDGLTFEAFVQRLNHQIFFWPGGESGPINYGVRHFERNNSETTVILRVKAADLFAANRDSAPRFCRFNSGSPRCVNGQKSPRGSNTFVDGPSADFTRGSVVEVTFQTRVLLPPVGETYQRPKREWEEIPLG